MTSNNFYYHHSRTHYYKCIQKSLERVLRLLQHAQLLVVMSQPSLSPAVILKEKPEDRTSKMTGIVLEQLAAARTQRAVIQYVASLQMVLFVLL